MRAAVLGLATAVAGVLLVDVPRADACGCLSPPAVSEGDFAVNQQSEQIIFEVEPGWVTAHVLINYAGDPASFGYDAAGNTLTRDPADGAAQALTWDAEGRLTQVSEAGSTVGEYVYSADGDRLVRREGGVTTVYLPGGEELSRDASGVVKASPGSSRQPNVVGSMPMRTRVVPNGSTSASARKLPEYTRLRARTSPLDSSVIGRRRARKGLCSAPDAPRKNEKCVVT